MTKLARLFLYALILMLVLQGCNTNDNDEVSSPPEEAPVEQEDTQQTNENTKQNGQQDGKSEQDGQNGQNKQDQLFKFTSFDLDVDYTDNQSYEVSYENERDGMEAKIENTLNNERISGDEAFNQLRPIFENLTIDQNTAKEEVISEVLEAFDLNADYTKFELDIDFADGTEKEYKG